MKQQERNKAITVSKGGNAQSLAELRAIRQSRRATSQRVEELKMKLFRLTEQHMDQAVNLIRRWMGENK